MKKKSSTLRKVLGANISVIRKKFGGTQAEFSNKYKITRAMLSSYETGSAEPKLQTILLLHETTGIDIYRLCTEAIEEDELPETPYPAGTKHNTISISHNTSSEAGSIVKELDQIIDTIKHLEERVAALEQKE